MTKRNGEDVEEELQTIWQSQAAQLSALEAFGQRLERNLSVIQQQLADIRSSEGKFFYWERRQAKNSLVAISQGVQHVLSQGCRQALRDRAGLPQQNKPATHDFPYLGALT